MNKIVKKEFFSENVVMFEVEAPEIAKSRKPGNFVIIRLDEKGERVPLTIAAADTERGTITIVAQRVGVTTYKLAELNVGDYIHDVVGPLGHPTHIYKAGTVLACGGGVGVAPLLPIVKAMKEAGNRVVSILAARNKGLIILEDEIRKYFGTLDMDDFYERVGQGELPLQDIHRFLSGGSALPKEMSLRFFPTFGSDKKAAARRRVS